MGAPPPRCQSGASGFQSSCTLLSRVHNSPWGREAAINQPPCLGGEEEPSKGVEGWGGARWVAATRTWRGAAGITGSTPSWGSRDMALVTK